MAEGQPHGRGLWFVHTGALSVLVTGSPEPVATILPTHWVGEVSLLDAGPPSATVVTAEPSVLLRLDADALERVRQRRPDVALALLDTLSRELVARIRATDLWLHKQLGEVEAEAEEPAWWESAVERLFGGGSKS